MNDDKEPRPGRKKGAGNTPSDDGGTADTDPVIPAAISKQLKRLYDDVANEPVPDRFAELLKQLEDRDGKDS